MFLSSTRTHHDVFFCVYDRDALQSLDSAILYRNSKSRGATLRAIAIDQEVIKTVNEGSWRVR